MKMKRIIPALVAMATGLGLGGWAQAGPVVLDYWSAGQNVTATSGTPFVSSTLSAPVVGAAAFLGDRTLSGTLTSAAGSVNCVIGGGMYEANLSVMAEGFCVTSYDVIADFVLGSVDYGAINDGAFSGTASVMFLKNMVAIGSESIAIGSANYSTLTGNTSFTAGDQFAIAWMGSIATDKAMTLVTGQVPEPGSLALASLAMTGLAWSRRRKQTKTT